MARRHEIAGAQGGRSTFRKHGASWMSHIGKQGLRATADKFFGGSVSDAMSWLRRRATESAIDRGIDAQLDARLAEGEEVACAELPVICEPEDDPTWQERVRDRRGAVVELPF